MRDILEAEEPFFTQSLREMEFLSGKKNIDVKLTADIMEKSSAAIRGLGLDPKDTTDRELYHALNQKIKLHNENLAESLGFKDSGLVKDIIPELIKIVEQTDINLSCWALKRSVAKDMLRNMPPKKMMKQLGYRSIESMFKNENFDEVYVALRFSEGEDWLREYDQLFSEFVQPSDFETRKIKIINMDKKWLDLGAKFIKNKGHNIAHAKEVGLIGVVPFTEKKLSGLTIKLLSLLFHYVNEIRLYSAYFKFKSTRGHFGKTVTDTLILDNDTGATIASFNIHWRSIQRYLGQSEAIDSIGLFQPHVHPEDLYWRRTEESLQIISSELKFWQDLNYVARVGKDGKPISFNIFDAAFSYCDDASFAKRYYSHLHKSLWNEIFIRYMGEPALREKVINQLDEEASS